MINYLIRRCLIAVITLLLITFLVYALIRNMPGTPLTLDQAVRNLARFTGCSRDDAIAAATISPRSMLGMATTLAASPDLVLLNQDLEVAATIVAGRIVFNAAA